jgi:hypothetical protein
MTLSEIYSLAKHVPDYQQFVQLVKVELTGLPYTQVINCEMEIRMKNDVICPSCHKYKRIQGNGILHQLCECGE